MEDERYGQENVTTVGMLFIIPMKPHFTLHENITNGVRSVGNRQEKEIRSMGTGIRPKTRSYILIGRVGQIIRCMALVG